MLELSEPLEKTLKDALRELHASTETAPSVTFAVEVASGPDQGKRLDVRAGRFLVGTSPACDLVLTDERISRRHLALSIE